MDIGQRIRFYREQLGLTQKELAEQLYVSERSVGHYETGTRIPPIDKVLLVAEALDVELTDLVEDTTKGPKEWFHFMVEQEQQMKKKFMDETRFRLFLKRIGQDCDVYEDEEWIKSSTMWYPKKLGRTLSKLTNENLTFTGIFYNEIPLGQWVVRGYCHGILFSFEITEKENYVEFRTKSTLALQTLFDKIVYDVFKWFEHYYSTKKINCDIETQVHLPYTSKKELLTMTLELFHFPDCFDCFVLLRKLKQDGIYTLGQFFEAKCVKSANEFRLLHRETFEKVEKWLAI